MAGRTVITGVGPKGAVFLGRDDKDRQFADALALHLDAAHNLARWLVGNGHDAEDVVQEAYLRAWRYGDTFRGGNLRAWLLALVRNSAFTWLGKNRPADLRIVELDTVTDVELPHDDANNPARWVERLSDQAFVTDALQRLPAEQREILVLREMEELAYKEIAGILEVPIGTVMSRLARARQALARELGHAGPVN